MKVTIGIKRDKAFKALILVETQRKFSEIRDYYYPSAWRLSGKTPVTPQDPWSL